MNRHIKRLCMWLDHMKGIPANTWGHGWVGTEPVVGRIQRIFSHEFGEQTYDLAVVHKCNSIRWDPDSGLYMWWTNDLRYTVVILPVTKLSISTGGCKRGISRLVSELQCTYALICTGKTMLSTNFTLFVITLTCGWVHNKTHHANNSRCRWIWSLFSLYW